MNSPNENGHVNGQAGAAQLLSLLTSRPQIDLRHYWFVILRRKWWGVVIVFLATAGCAIYAWLYIRPVYESSSTIQVLPSRLLNRSVREVTPGVSDAVDYRELQRKILSTDYLLQLAQRPPSQRQIGIHTRGNLINHPRLEQKLMAGQLRLRRHLPQSLTEQL